MQTPRKGEANKVISKAFILNSELLKTNKQRGKKAGWRGRVTWKGKRGQGCYSLGGQDPTVFPA